MDDKFSKSDESKLIPFLLQTLSRKRKKQLFLLSSLIIFSGISEIFTISSIQPLLKIITDKQIEIKSKFIEGIYNFFLNFISIDKLIFILSIFIIFLTFSACLRLITIFSINFISALIGNEIGTMAFESSLTNNYEYHLNTNTSKIISTIVTKSNSTVDTIKSLLNIFTSLVILIAIITTLLKINIQITVFTILSISSIYFFISIFIKNRLSDISQIRSTLIQKQTQSLQEGLGFIKDIILDKCHFFFIDSFRLKDKKLRIIDAKSDFLASSPKYLLEIIAIFFLLIFTLFLNKEIGVNNNIFSVLGTIAFGMQRILPLIQQIYASFVIIEANKVSVLNTLNLIQDKSNSRFFRKTKKIKKYNFKSKIELVNVSFKYKNDNDYFLKNINLTIHKGQKIGIVGESGCGKSTLADIIMGLLKPCQGKILIDKNDLHQNNCSPHLDEWHSCLSHVPQDVYLSDSTIASNIAFGIKKEDINTKTLKKALLESQLNSFISNSKEGLYTKVGENGVQLSGGQKQRVGIARAIYKGGDIIILDESTNSLDSKTEESILECIGGLSRDYTIIIISHRESTLSFCDKIIKLE